MPPTKRKAQTRRQVLDLKGEDASSRSTWQTKYQNIQFGNGIHQNGESQLKSEETASPNSCTMTTNPLTGLVGNYNSDSDGEDTADVPKKSLDSKVEDFLKEIQSISHEPKTAAENCVRNTQSYPGTFYQPQVSKWQQCYDHNSGYPYYWNTETNEVTWEIPLEFKAAVESAAVQRHQTSHYEQTHALETSAAKVKNPKPKPTCKYPWQDSDSEDEKIEMITSFGPQSGEEESQEGAESAKSKTHCDKSKTSVKDNIVGPQLPTVPLVQYGTKRLSDLDDTEAESLNDSSYETSSLLTYRVPDTGPPGDDSFNNNNESQAEKQTNLKNSAFNSSCSEVPDDCVKKELESEAEEKTLKTDKTGVSENCDSISDGLPGSQTAEESNPVKSKEVPACFDFADNVIAEIEKEMPPDYSAGLAKKSEEVVPSESKAHPTEENPHKSGSTVKSSGISGFALLANYEDDSESEEGSICEKRKSRDSPTKVVTPAEQPEEKTVKPLFPCMEAEMEKHGKDAFPVEKPSPLSVKPDTRPEGETGNIYDPEPDSTMMHKAFKRKKRIEFATVAYGGAATEAKPFSPDHSTVTTSQYSIDPSCNDHRGFGFSSSASEPSKKSSKIHGGWIQFVKTETILPSQNVDHKQKAESRTEGKTDNAADDSVTEEEIDDNATLLKEKVTFLTEGKDEISPIQYIAIQLETLSMAWQQRALSKKYFSRWVKEKCSDLIRHEKSAAPPGWTCLWDRKSKRYFYRNAATKVVQWEYPTSEESSATAPTGSKSAKEPETEGGGEEMELCFTPPHQSSPDEDKGVHGERPTTPPPPVISDSSEALASASTVPVRASSDADVTGVVQPTKKKREEIAKEEETCATAPPKAEEKRGNAPPLPPMPPPPDEPPPPLPNSPPPLPLDPDQPLPPGVDEPEYGMFRRSSPKQTYKKSQTEAPAYPSDVIVGYGYAVQVQASGNPIAIQPVDYRGYVRDSLTGNPYVVQSAPSSHVIHCPAKKSKLSLSSELDSFYSDIAMLDTGPTESSAEKVPTETSVAPEPAQPVSAPPTNQTVQSKGPASNPSTTASVVKPAENPSFNGAATKKKKKSKLTPGLSMKKKGVSSLVAKWQQVQQEVRWDLNSDDDEDEDSTSHK